MYYPVGPSLGRASGGHVAYGHAHVARGTYRAKPLLSRGDVMAGPAHQEYEAHLQGVDVKTSNW